MAQCDDYRDKTPKKRLESKNEKQIASKLATLIEGLLRSIWEEASGGVIRRRPEN